MSKLSDSVVVLGIVVLLMLFGVLFIAGPLLSIWCLNTLITAAAIPYNFSTWFASFLLFGFLSAFRIKYES